MRCSARMCPGLKILRDAMQENSTFCKHDTDSALVLFVAVTFLITWGLIAVHILAPEIASATALDGRHFDLQDGTYRSLRQDRPTREEIEAGHLCPPGTIHLPNWADSEWLKQFTAEQLVTVRTKRDFARLEWQKLRECNEALDCRVYARAATWIHGADRGLSALGRSGSPARDLGTGNNRGWRGKHQIDCVADVATEADRAFELHGLNRSKAFTDIRSRDTLKQASWRPLASSDATHSQRDPDRGPLAQPKRLALSRASQHQT